jgi:dihydroflavonol-4-reductase
MLKGIDNIKYCIGDINNPNSYENNLKECNIVVHTAAISDFGISNPKKYYKVNHEGTRQLLSVSLKNNIEKFIHTSTRGTLGTSEKPESANETSIVEDIDSLDDYIKSKLLGEQEVVKYSKEKGFFCVILSPTAMIGTFDTKPTPIGNILFSFLDKKLNAYMNGGINIIDVEDAASAFVSAIDKGKNGQIYILGNNNITLQNLFKKFSKISNVPEPMIKLPYYFTYFAALLLKLVSKISGITPFATPKKVISLHSNRSYCNAGKAVNKLNLKLTPLDDTLRKIYVWYKEKK